MARVGRRRARRRVRRRLGGHRPTAHAVGGVRRGRRHGPHGFPDHLRSGGRRGPHVDLGSRRRYRGAGAPAAPHARGTGLRLRACMAGWIGITSSVGDGVSASVLRRLGPDDRALPVARGTRSRGCPAPPPSASCDRARPGPVRGSPSVPGSYRSASRWSASTGSGAASPSPSRETGTCPTSRSSATGSPPRCASAPGTPSRSCPGIGSSACRPTATCWCSGPAAGSSSPTWRGPGPRRYRSAGTARRSNRSGCWAGAPTQARRSCSGSTTTRRGSSA